MNGSVRAERLRTWLRLSWPLDVDALADRLDVCVHDVDWPPELLAHPSAVAAGAVVVARRLERRRRREVIAHELHHALYDVLDMVSLIDSGDVRLAQMERRATAFADELLMPLSEVRDVCHWSAEDAACWFGVTPDALAARWQRAG